MISLLLAAAAMPAADAEATACGQTENEWDTHLVDVCDERFSGGPVYSATIQASLNPRPAARQIIVFETSNGWMMRISGYRWQPGTSVVETRRNEVPVSAEDAARVEAALSASKIGALASLPYYGSKDRICTDGASLSIDAALEGNRFSARQHSCAGRTEMNTAAAVLVDLALSYDPQFEGFLGGF